MKMVLTLALLLAANTYAATQFFLKSTSLNSPYYETLDELFVETNQPSSGVITILFFNQTNEEEGRLMKRVKGSDYIQCSVSSCTLSLGYIPLSLKKSSCKISIQSNQKSQEIKWGECKALGMKPSERFLADFTIDEYEVFDQSSVIKIQNGGAGVLNKKIEIWAFIKDENQKIIWSGRSVNTGDFPSQTSSSFVFPRLKNHDYKLGCNVLFIIDPKQDHFEQDKLNNVTELPFGECDKTPSYESGDRVDFEPSLNKLSGSYTLKIRNSGRLSFIDLTTTIETRIHFFDANNNELWMEYAFFTAPLFGFGDEKEIYQKDESSNWCKVVVDVNPHFIFKESNYQNNTKEFNYCL